MFWKLEAVLCVGFLGVCHVWWTHRSVLIWSRLCLNTNFIQLHFTLKWKALVPSWRVVVQVAFVSWGPWGLSRFNCVGCRGWDRSPEEVPLWQLRWPMSFQRWDYLQRVGWCWCRTMTWFVVWPRTPRTVLVASKPFRGYSDDSPWVGPQTSHNPQPQHIQLLKRCLKIEEEHSSPNARDFHQHLATTCQFDSLSTSHRLLRLNGLKTRRCRSFPSHLALIRWLSDRRLLRTGVVLLRLKAPVEQVLLLSHLTSKELKETPGLVPADAKLAGRRGLDHCAVIWRRVPQPYWVPLGHLGSNEKTSIALVSISPLFRVVVRWHDMTCVCCRRQGGNLIKFELRDIKAPWLSKRSSMVVPSLVYPGEVQQKTHCPGEDQLKTHFRCRMLQKRRAMFWCDLKCDLCFTKSILADWLGGSFHYFHSKFETCQK